MNSKAVRIEPQTTRVTRAGNRIRRALGKSLVVGAACILTLGLLEAILQVTVGLPVRDVTFSLRQSHYYQKDQFAGWRPRPLVQGAHTVKGVFDSTFSTNSHGLRGPEIAKKKRPGEIRVVLLGDSFTWGFGVDDHEIFSAHLDQLLGDVTVINMGVTAYNLDRELRFLKHYGLDFEPDLVVLNAYANDIQANEQRGREASLASVDPTGTLNENTGTSAALKQFLGKHSALYNFVVQRINGNRPLVRFLVRIGIKDGLAGFEQLDSDLRPALRVYPDSMKTGQQRAYEVLLQMKQLLDEHDIPLLIALAPTKVRIHERLLVQHIAYTHYEESDFDLAKPEVFFAEFAADHGIPFISPYREFKRHDPKKLFFKQDPHFTPEGHRLYAEVLAPWISSYLPRQDS